MKEDSVGRPIYKRKEPTSQGKQVYLYHIHQTKKWRIGPAHEGAEAHNCWLFITSKGKIQLKRPIFSQKMTYRKSFKLWIVFFFLALFNPIWPQNDRDYWISLWNDSESYRLRNNLKLLSFETAKIYYLDWPFPNRKGRERAHQRTMPAGTSISCGTLTLT